MDQDLIESRGVIALRRLYEGCQPRFRPVPLHRAFPARAVQRQTVPGRSDGVARDRRQPVRGLHGGGAHGCARHAQRGSRLP